MLRHAFKNDGRMHFRLSRDGQSRSEVLSLYTEVFAAIAMAEYSKATGDEAAWGKAVDMYELLVPRLGQPSDTPMLGYPAFEHTWAMILALTKNVCAENALMHAGGWQAGATVGLKDKTLGLLGLGKLGAQSAAVGNAFGMRVIAWSQNLTDERARECGAERVDKNALLAQSDVVSIHLVLSDRTRGLIGADELAAMKACAYLVNTSRGPIVDEDALVQALRDGDIAGAGVDVFDVEPLPAAHPYRGLANLVLTGHTGYSTREGFECMYPDTVECISAWLSGSPVRVLND